MPNPKKTSREPKKEISDPDEFFRQGLGPGYAEEEFGQPDAAEKKPGDPASLRNRRGDRYTRFDKPARNGNAPTRKG
ncbi:MAG: hypothetical protein K0S54_3239 [Alphaproteobacteria bacterium]|jgi:hypothetical protein|nr:hypothetical protein [Alphaproteobacteria bacterium]